jgi:hypothetical protein
LNDKKRETRIHGLPGVPMNARALLQNASKDVPVDCDTVLAVWFDENGNVTYRSSGAPAEILWLIQTLSACMVLGIRGDDSDVF